MLFCDLSACVLLGGLEGRFILDFASVRFRCVAAIAHQLTIGPNGIVQPTVLQYHSTTTAGGVSWRSSRGQTCVESPNVSVTPTLRFYFVEAVLTLSV